MAFSCLERFCIQWDVQLKPSACWISSSGPGAACRSAKREARYTAMNGTVVPHKGHARELGAHLNYGHARAAPTMVERARKAQDFLHRLGVSSIPRAKKVAMVAPGALQPAVWGAEASHVSKHTTVYTLTSCVSAVLKPRKGKTTKRNPDLTCLFGGGVKSFTKTSIFWYFVVPPHAGLAELSLPARPRCG